MITGLKGEIATLEGYRVFLADEVHREKERRRSWIRTGKTAKTGLITALMLAGPLIVMDTEGFRNGSLVMIFTFASFVLLLAAMYLLQEKTKRDLAESGGPQGSRRERMLSDLDDRILRLREELRRIEQDPP